MALVFLRIVWELQPQNNSSASLFAKPFSLLGVFPRSDRRFDTSRLDVSHVLFGRCHMINNRFMNSFRLTLNQTQPTRLA